MDALLWTCQDGSPVAPRRTSAEAQMAKPGNMMKLYDDSALTIGIVDVFALSVSLYLSISFICCACIARQRDVFGIGGSDEEENVSSDEGMWSIIISSYDVYIFLALFPKILLCYMHNALWCCAQAGTTAVHRLARIAINNRYKEKWHIRFAMRDMSILHLLILISRPNKQQNRCARICRRTRA